MAEAPKVWVYDLQHLYSGLDFGEASVHIAATNRPKLYRKAQQQFGADFRPLMLMTKGGLEHPMAIAVDGRLLSFTERVGIYPMEVGEKEDLISWTMKQRAPIKELEGRDWEIWAMKQYPNPNPQQRLRYVFKDITAALFDPQSTSEQLENLVIEIYRELVDYDKRLEEHKPIALGWYTRGSEHFRVATRPYRTGDNLDQHRLVITTTISPQPSHS